MENAPGGHPAAISVVDADAEHTAPVSPAATTVAGTPSYSRQEKRDAADGRRPRQRRGFRAQAPRLPTAFPTRRVPSSAAPLFPVSAARRWGTAVSGPRPQSAATAAAARAIARESPEPTRYRPGTGDLQGPLPVRPRLRLPAGPRVVWPVRIIATGRITDLVLRQRADLDHSDRAGPFAGGTTTRTVSERRIPRV